MNIQLDIDEERVTRKLSIREKLGIRLLLVLFLIVYPAKYSHQVKELFGKIFDGADL